MFSLDLIHSMKRFVIFVTVRPIPSFFAWFHVSTSLADSQIQIISRNTFDKLVSEYIRNPG